MPDMLVKLYTLPDIAPYLQKQAADGVSIRRALAPEKHRVLAWVAEHFSRAWASETEVCFSRQPNSCFLAVEGDILLGFACYDSVCLDFFGPTGVREDARGRGIGAALLMACLHDMHSQGYGYAIIGAAGPTDFYSKIVSAVAIPDSWPGVYSGLLRDVPLPGLPDAD